MEEQLGKIAMRVIGFGIVGAIVLVLVAQGVDGFPFEIWGLVGAMNLDVVAMLFGSGSTISRGIYILVGLAALWGFALFRHGGGHHVGVGSRGRAA